MLIFSGALFPKLSLQVLSRDQEGKNRETPHQNLTDKLQINYI